MARGRELLTLGEAERAAFTLAEALALWRGPPFAELEDWEPGRIEAGRLEELRLEAEELLDRRGAAGRAPPRRPGRGPGAWCGAPLRERRWGLLALAQYQSGQQSEALRTLQQAYAGCWSRSWGSTRARSWIGLGAGDPAAGPVLLVVQRRGPEPSRAARTAA